MARMHKEFNTVVSRELLGLIAGKKLGEGVYRAVYKFKPDPTLVIKFELGSGDFQNVQEWTTWNAVEHTEHASWYAPCHAISPCGVILLQKYAKDLPESQLPERIPAHLEDAHEANWGLFEGRPVCRDYGRAAKRFSNVMRKASWEEWTD